MPLSNVFRRLKADTSTLDDLSAELGRQDRIRAEAQAALHDLGTKRPGLLVEGTDAQLAKLDSDLAMHRRVQEQAEARIAAIEPEWRAADARETTARLDRARLDRYAAASKARTEGAKILDAYEREAAALATKLRRLVDIDREIDAANRDLPEDYPPIPGAEPFNGRLATPDVWPEHDVWVGPDGAHHGHAAPGAQPPHGYTRKTVTAYTAIPGTPGFPHRPLTARVCLPAVDPSAAPHWAPGVAVPRRSVEAEAFLLQHGVRP